MENLVVIKTDDLRQIIRDEISTLSIHKETNRPFDPPITTKQLCVFLGITEPTVIRWRKKGKIPFMQIGSALRYDKEAVIKAISEKRRGGIQK
jgi:excisionase family DNA binding protein